LRARAEFIERLCQGALDRTGGERDSWLREACGGDAAAHAEVSRLLALSDSATTFLETPAMLVAQAQGHAALATGESFSHYTVTGSLGVGGMGEVYRARDERLRRDVALKVLPELLALDPERVRRFEREAQAVAAVNHPNIAAIFGVEESAGRRALVLELVEGATLAERVARGRIPVSETLAIARQFAEALEAAHARGVIHRDLKPANIKLRADGTIKVLDFGLAKMFDEVSEPATNGADASTPGPLDSHPGMLLGTAAYMAPEQARGAEVDARADVWAFGCVVYEMLTAKPAFPGETRAQVLEAVNSRDVDFSALPDTTPEPLRRLLRRCLARERNSRLRDLGDAKLDIEDALTARADPPAPRVRPWLWGSLAVAAVALALAWGWSRRPPAPEPRAAEIRSELAIPPTMEPTSFELSPDGGRLAFVANDAGRSRLWIRDLRSREARSLPGTEGAAFPFWSPDGRAIGFFANRKVMVVDVADGAVRTVARTRIGWGGAWTPDGDILFAFTQRTPIRRVSLQGGEVSGASELLPKESGHRFPVMLPGGRHFLHYSWSRSEGGAIFVRELHGPAARRLIAAESAAIYTRGHLLFGREGTLYAQAFDATRLEMSGDAFPVAKNVSHNMVSGRLGVSASASGVLVYREASTAVQRQFVWFDRQGRELQRVGPAEEEQGPASPALSPDGQRVAWARGGAGNPDVWLMDVDDGKLTRLTLSDFSDTAAVWSPDGSKVAFASDSPDGRVLRAYATSYTPGATYEPLSPPLGERSVVPQHWSPDGKYLLCDIQGSVDTGNEIVALSMDAERRLIFVAKTPFEERAGQFSPDGRYIAYHSDESGRYEVYAQPFLAQGERAVISDAGGTQARWSHDGKELFYIAADSGLMSVALRREGDQLRFAKPVKLFQTQITPGLPGQGDSRAQYVVSHDSKRFLIRTQLRVEHAPLIVVNNWWR
jgi:Tol biopolymer transport system component